MTQLVPIDQLVDRVGTWDPRHSPTPTFFVYIDIGAVDQQSKQIVEPRKVLSSEAPSRARQVVKAGDILVSTVRPNLNAVAEVPDDLDGATASTGFCVLRPKPGIDGAYLFQWVRSPRFIAEMTRRATGQSYPAVSDRIVKHSEVPLPPLSTQRKISEILKRADALCMERRNAIRLLDELPCSIFINMFGDPIKNDGSWPIVRVGDFIAGFESGKNIAAAPDDTESTYRILKVSAVTSGTFNELESKPVPPNYLPPASHFVRDGDLLFSRANTSELIGATARVNGSPQGVVLPDKLWRFVWYSPNRTDPLYVHHLFWQPAFRDQVSRNATGTSGSMKNISQVKVLGISCGFPPLDLQRNFGTRVGHIETMRRVQETQLRELDALFLSLQYSVFSGHLWHNHGN
jgi:type I restriction enzyme, S subunit